LGALASEPASFSKELLEDEDGEQGLGLSVQFGWTPSGENEITQHYGVSLQYTGLIPDRDADILGLGVHHVSLCGQIQSLESRYSETAIEVFYKYQLNEFLSLKPDVHYIVNPNGDGRDAIAAGVRVEISF
jgi:carbohydrate-selective porin OprB